MTKTEHYQLPQWEASDPVRRADFNAAFASLDEGLAGVRSTAQAAQTTANAAQNTAQAAAEAKPYVVGTYKGTGAQQSITVGFRPSFLVVSGLKQTRSTNTTSDFDRYFGMTAGNVMPSRVSFTDTGFTVYPSDTTYCYYPDFSDSGRTYDYIAFR